MSLRQERLSEEIRSIIAGHFLGDQMQDPRLQGVSITHVKLTGDLQLATVYFRLLEPDNKEKTLKGLDHCSGFLRKKLADALRLRRVPVLRFSYDESVDTGSKMEALLSKIEMP